MFPALVRAQRSIPRISPAALGTCVLLGVLAIPTVWTVTAAWRRHPDYEYAWLLAPVVAWLFLRAKPWRHAGEPRSVSGLLTLVTGGMLHLAAQIVTWPLLDFAGWLLLVRGTLLGLWGLRAATSTMPVLLLAFFLFPLPMAWLNVVAHWMQEIISQLAAGVLSLLWVCHRQGNVIQIAGLDVPLSVAVECSGVRQLLVFAAMAALLALSLPGRGRGLVLLGAALPIALVANVLRIFGLAILARTLGTDAIQGVFHDAPLLLSLPLGGLALWALFCWLRIPRSDFNDAATTSLNEVALPRVTRYRPVLVSLAALAALQITLQLHLHAAQPGETTITVSLQSLTMTLGAWHGQTHPEAALLARRADFADETLTRIYADDKGHAVAVYLVFSQTGRDREHHPEICLRDVTGARELAQGRRLISLTRGQAERMAYQRGFQRTTVYYWHYAVLPRREGLTFLQSLYLRQHEHLPSLSVQVQFNTTDPLAWNAVETTLLPALDRQLQSLLPPNLQVGCDRLAVRMVGD